MPSRAGGKRYAMGIRKAGCAGVEIGVRMSPGGVQVTLTIQGAPLLDFQLKTTMTRQGQVAIEWPALLSPSNTLQNHVEARIRSMLSALTTTNG